MSKNTPVIIRMPWQKAIYLSRVLENVLKDKRFDTFVHDGTVSTLDLSLLEHFQRTLTKAQSQIEMEL